MTAGIHTVMVPGLACSARLWDTLMPTAWAHGAATIADTRRDDSITGMAERLLDDAPRQFVLAGISMGGYVCLEVMRLASERVVGLALISTAAAPDTTEQQASRARQRELVLAGKFDALVGAAFPTLVDAANVDDPALKDLWSTMAHEVGPEVFLTQLQAATERADARPTLPGIACPTAIIHGTGDRTIDAQNGRDSAATIPGSRLTLLDGAGHMAAQERPDAVVTAVVELFDSL